MLRPLAAVALLAVALLALPVAAQTGRALGVSPTPPAVGRPTFVTVATTQGETAGPQTITLRLGPTATMGQCGGLVFTGTLSPAAVPCVVVNGEATVSADLPAHAVFALLAEAHIERAGTFAVDAAAGGVALPPYRAEAAWRVYLPGVSR